MLHALKALFLASRPKTLTAAWVPLSVGSALAVHSGFAFRGDLVGWALFCSLAIQIATNLINDALDFKKGADTAQRLGPRRATQSGWLTEKQVWGLGIGFFGLAVLGSGPLILAGGWPIVLIGAASLAAGYGYTGGPFPIAYLGLGELFVLIFFGLVPVAGIFFLHSHVWSSVTWLGGLQVGFLATVLIAINHWRDAKTDVLVAKKTLAVRFGERFAVSEILFCLLAPFLLQAGWWWQDSWAAFGLPWLSFPLALFLMWQIFYFPDSPSKNEWLGLAAALHSFFGILLSIGLWWGY